VREEVIEALSGGVPSPRTLERRQVDVNGVDEWSDAASPRGVPAAGGGRSRLLAIAAASFPLGLLVGWLIWG